MRFDIITIFPEIFDSYLKESIIKRALKKRLIIIKVHNLRKWARDRHKTVDDRPYGGGFGMVMKVEPVYRAVSSLKKIKNPPSPSLPVGEAGLRRAGKKQRTKVILFTPRGKKFTQNMGYQFSKLSQIIFICGRYEGVDERVAEHIADEKISVGDYVLMGGELPALTVIETISRLIPGVLGKPQLLKERIPPKSGRAGRGFTEYAQYTRPPKFFPEKFRRARPGQLRKAQVWKVPKVLLSGDHKKIAEWKKKHSKVIAG